MSIPRSPRTLQLPNPSSVRPGHGSRPTRRRQRISRVRLVVMGLLLSTAGIATLLALLRLPSQLDTVLLVSKAIANLIKGLTHLGLGLLQLAGVLAFAMVALLALVLLGAGLSRLMRAVAPRPPTRGPGGGQRRATPGDTSPLPPQFEGDPSLEWLRSLRDQGESPPMW